MKRLTLRCPDELYEQLSLLAKQHYRSTHGEVLAILNDSLAAQEVRRPQSIDDHKEVKAQEA